jgi:tetraacyldisaccharide 4'-kinase
VIALAGLARPSGFLATLGHLGMQIEIERLFGDHHRFTEPELTKLRAESQAQSALIVTTEKDQVRLPPGFPAWVVRLEVEILSGEPLLLEKLAG